MGRQKKSDTFVQEKVETEEETPKTAIVEEKIVVINRQDSPKQEDSKARLRRLIEEETKLVKGRFKNYESPGGSLPLFIKKYPDIPPFDKVLFDGEMYEVPLYVARHLNGVDALAEGCGRKINTCAYPTHGFKWDPGKPMPQSTEGSGGIPVPIVGVAKWNRRFGFESLEFDTDA